MSGPEDKNIYGGTILPRLKIVKKKHGSDGLDELLSEMRQRGYVGPLSLKEIKVKEKIPLESYLIFLRTYKDLYGGKRLIMMSEKAPEKHGIVGMFLRWAGTPEMLLEKAGNYWLQFFDFGTLEGKKLKKGKGELIGTDICTASPILCENLTHYFRGVFKNVDLKKSEIIHDKCENKGDDFGRWTIKWIK